MKSFKGILSATRNLVVGSEISQNPLNELSIDFDDAVMIDEYGLTSSMMNSFSQDESFGQEIKYVDNILGLSAFDCEAAEKEIAEEELNSILVTCDNEDSAEVAKTDFESITSTFLEPSIFICQMPTIAEKDEEEDDVALSPGAAS